MLSERLTGPENSLRPHFLVPASLQARVRKFGAKLLQLLAEWTETFPRDFEEESTIGHLTDVVGRISPCDEVGQTAWKSLLLPVPSHPGPEPVSSSGPFSPRTTQYNLSGPSGAHGRTRPCTAERESKALFQPSVSTSPFCPGNGIGW